MRQAQNFDPETENLTARQLLSTLWMCPEYIPVTAQILSHDGLLLPTAEHVWQVIKGHVGNNKLDIPKALAAIHSSREASEFFRLAQEENYSPKRYTERQIKEWSSLLAEQGLRRLGTDITHRAKSGFMDNQRDLDEVISSTMQELAGLRNRGGANTWRSQDEIATETLQILDAMERGEIVDGVMTGFPSIDAVLSGGFPDGELAILGARPSIGKTSAALELAFNMAEEWYVQGIDKCVAFFSAETTGPKLQFRMACSLTKVSLAKMRAGRATKEEFHRVREALAYIRKLPIYYDETSRPTTQQMLLRAMSLDNVTIGGQRKRVGIIFFDFLELAGDQDANEVLRIGKIVYGLKDIAKGMMIPVVALCQLDRSVEGRMPTMKDLRWSSTIEQTAYTIIFLHRPSFYKRAKDKGYMPHLDNERYLAIWMIAKYKDGCIGPVEMRFEEEYTRFSDPHDMKEKW